MSRKSRKPEDAPYEEPLGGSYFRESPDAPARLVERTGEAVPEPAATPPATTPTEEGN